MICNGRIIRLAFAALAGSSNSIGTGLNSPSRPRNARCRSAPTSIAMRAEPRFDEYMKTSGTLSIRCLP